MSYKDDPDGGTLFKIMFSIAAIVIGAILVSIAFRLDKFEIVGHSMFPSAMHGDNVVTNNRFLFMDIDYHRNDVIVFAKDARIVIKRIIGLPGERLEINDSEIKIDGKQYTNRAILNYKMDEVRDLTLGPDQYYMLGDNRPYSLDSRHHGSIKKSEIIGKVLIRWRSLFLK